MSTETMNREQAKEILEKYNNGSADARERAMLDNWFLQESRKSEGLDDDGKFVLLKGEIWEKTLLKSGLDTSPRSRMFRLWPRIAASVALIGLASAVFFYFNSDKLPVTKAQYVADVAPGGTKATLTLANGDKISLTDASNGSVAKQAGVKITKMADGRIVYSVVASGDETVANGEVMKNTITTPNGGKYEVILPDGTKVTLNAASSLTFPTAFIGTERQVKLAGEAYFEVAENKEMPFTVNSGVQTVEVLGTHFNINAYPDERTLKTTLVEGSVKVMAGSMSTVIVPGQQTALDSADPANISRQYVDIDKETAWKNDVFAFDKADVRSVMRQISRWYDVEVVYVGQFPDEDFFGEISRKSNLSKVAKILELNNIKLEINGRIVKVSYIQPSRK